MLRRQRQRWKLLRGVANDTPRSRIIFFKALTQHTAITTIITTTTTTSTTAVAFIIEMFRRVNRVAGGSSPPQVHVCVWLSAARFEFTFNNVHARARLIWRRNTVLCRHALIHVLRRRAVALLCGVLRSYFCATLLIDMSFVMFSTVTQEVVG